MRTKSIALSIALMLVLGLTGLCAVATSHADVFPFPIWPSVNQTVYPVDSVIFGRTYGEWSAAWWQWALSIPGIDHPLFDNGDCSEGQSGPVWFLGGKFCQTGAPNCMFTGVVRYCTVPAGKALYFPILNADDSSLEHQPVAATIAQLRQNVEGFVGPAANLSVSAVLDGWPIRSLKEQFRMQSTVFEFTLPDDNVLNAIGEGPFKGGTYSPAVDEGYYLMLKPLQPGNHVLHFSGSAGSFALDVTYHIKVQ